jgi:hypothetical protein
MRMNKAPGVAGLRSSPAQFSGEVGSELQAPMLDALMCHHDASFGQDQLDVTQIETEPLIQPDAWLTISAGSRCRGYVAGSRVILGALFACRSSATSSLIANAFSSHVANISLTPSLLEHDRMPFIFLMKVVGSGLNGRSVVLDFQSRSANLL